MSRIGVGIVAALLVFICGRPSYAYLKFGVQIGGRNVTVKWNQTPVRYFVGDGGAPGVDQLALAAALDRAFSTWQNVSMSSIAYQFGGFTAASPGENDGRSTIGFLAAPELERVLASTDLLIDDLTGELLEADIFFNTAFPWSVAPEGDPTRFDLETIAVHEIGHFSGLGHSALGETELRPTGGRRVIAAESVMFPIAFGAGSITARKLRADDIAGISDLYPDGGFQEEAGSISGRVTKNGQGVFGAHVVAFNPATRSLVGNFTLNSRGEFSIGGLSPGPHAIRVEPLDDADVDSFFDSDIPVDLDMRAAFFNNLVVVPRGGDTGAVEIKVIPK